MPRGVQAKGVTYAAPLFNACITLCLTHPVWRLIRGELLPLGDRSSFTRLTSTAFSEGLPARRAPGPWKAKPPPVTNSAPSNILNIGNTMQYLNDPLPTPRKRGRTVQHSICHADQPMCGGALAPRRQSFRRPARAEDMCGSLRLPSAPPCAPVDMHPRPPR